MKKKIGVAIEIQLIITVVLLWSSFSVCVAETVIDNGNTKTSFTGSWFVSGGAIPWDPALPGAVSLWSRNGATYSWTFTPTESGYHDVSMWWTEWPSRSTSIPINIDHWGGTDKVYVNQQLSGGQWNSLGTYAFEAGKKYKITIISQPGPTSTCADAIKIESLPLLNVLPVAVIDSITANPALSTEVITFAGHGDDLDGSISSYLWESDIDGFLGDEDSFTSAAPLSKGTHTISFTVYDDDGEPSQTVSQVLVVQDEISSWVIDNDDPGTSFSGFWGASSGLQPWNPAKNGATSLWSRNGDTYTWRFTPSKSGNHELSMWWTEWSSRSNSIPVSIFHANGKDTVYINQQINGGMWNRLGAFNFSAGTNYYITITSQPGPSSTCADAVKIEFIGDATNLIPTARIDAVTPIAVVPGDEITFMGIGTDDDGWVAAHEWESDIDGLLSDQEMFSTAALSPGIHSISFRVKDDMGAWSAHAMALAVVRNCDRPVAIMPLGDSITLGYGETTHFKSMTGYRAPLHQQLVAHEFNFDFVGNQVAGYLLPVRHDTHHQGLGGITAASVADNVYNWLVENPAEIVLLHIGTNGLTSNPSSVEDILDEIDQYEIDFGNHVAVILARIINRMPYEPMSTLFNENLQVMAESRIAAGDKLIVVNQEDALDYATDMNDKLHPNGLGYEKMTGPWFDQLQTLLPECISFKPFIFTTPVDSTMIGSAYAYKIGVLGIPAPLLSLVSGPTGMTFNSANGEITWTPSSDQIGSHSVVIQASSPMGIDEQRFNVAVTNETIIIDNGDPNTFYSGTWSVSGGANPFDPADRAANSLYGRDGDTYTWTFTPNISGSYQFSMWWTQYASRSTSIPVWIESAGGTEAVYINQQINGGRWNDLGAFHFTAGVNYNIMIVSQPGPSSTCADAIRFVKE